MKASIWNGSIDGPGIYLGVPMGVYRADPCPAPSLNASLAIKCLSRSMAHVAAAHPKVSPAEPDEDDEVSSPTRAMDIGSAAHALAFGAGSEISLIQGANWKKKEAQEARKAAWAIGEIPLIPKEYRKAKAMAAISGPIIDGLLEGSVVAEAMIVSQDEEGFWYRGLIDRARADFRVVVDYKTTGRVASPDEATKLVYTSGNYFQEGFYRKILDRLDPEGAGRRKFWFLYQEQDEPHLPCLVEVSEAGRTLADEQVDASINLWKRALVTEAWPGYPIGPHIASPPPWLLTHWESRAMFDETLNPMELA